MSPHQKEADQAILGFVGYLIGAGAVVALAIYGLICLAEKML